MKRSEIKDYNSPMRNIVVILTLWRTSSVYGAADIAIMGGSFINMRNRILWSRPFGGKADCLWPPYGEFSVCR